MPLLQTAFHARTAALGARFDEYAGYELPYGFSADVLDEYWACRQRAVVMDLTPLRKVEVTGPGAFALLQFAATRDLRRLGDGDVVYSALCDDEGRLLDDGTIFRFGPERFRWVGYTDDDEALLAERAERLGVRVDLEASTHRLHNVAVQGPASREIVSAAVSMSGSRPVSELRWFSFTTGSVGGADDVLVSRTGYSGELGYVLWCRPEDGPALWDALLKEGAAKGLCPFGLDALDIIRIEAGLIFKGYEYEGSEDPFEAGIGFTVAAAKPDDFAGSSALASRREHPTQRLVGLEVEGSEPAAHGDEIFAGDERAGVVTSGAFSPMLDKNLALARVAADRSAQGERLDVRRSGGGSAAARVVRFPFYDPEKTRPRS